MKGRTKIISLLAVVLLIYGYLCRWFSIYFFWDSKSIGWTLLLIGTISYLIDNIAIRDSQNKKTILNKIGIGLLSFIIVVGAIFSISVRLFSDSYDVATDFIKNDNSLKEELGGINGFSLVTTGSIQTETNSEGEFGLADFELTAKGEKKFKDLTIQLIKNPDNPNWKVELMK
jgi:hypothetical protein